MTFRTILYLRVILIYIIQWKILTHQTAGLSVQTKKFKRVIQGGVSGTVHEWIK